MHLLPVHGIHCLGCDDHTEVAIGSFKGSVEDAGGGVYTCQDQCLGVEPMQQELQASGVEAIVAFLASNPEVARDPEGRDNLGSRAARQVVLQDTLAGLFRVIVDCLPERVGSNLARFSVLGHHMDNGYPEGTEVLEEPGGPVDQRCTPLMREWKRCDGGIQMTSVHVDGNQGRPVSVEQRIRIHKNV